MEKKAPFHKGVYILPNMITTLSLFSGFMSILWSFEGNFYNAALAIIFAALMDGLDGKVARLTHTSSEFGVQFDSLADLIAFGMAPAFLMWQWQLDVFNRLGIAISFIFLACGALRLARFNVSTVVQHKKFFIGLPIPAAGCTISAFALFYVYVPQSIIGIVPHFSLILTLVLALLMVSRIRYFSFKEYGFLKTHPFRSMVTFILVFSLVISQPRLLFFLLCIIYVLFGLIYTFIILPRRNRELMRSLSLQD